ncbi:MAG: DNA-directed RNA polymerase subunit alpha [Candidatus Margulisiibacteriota bacterium]|nr:DNA-directed RNA polymerase subunit alpha [Candidatus Margulisiibacteriota bacterium]
MIMLGEKPWVRYEEESSGYGRFVVEPLERGYGATLGNSLRRVLLSSLPGAAITSIKIDGVTHEFSTIPGVVEDTLQIILNLKEIVFRCHSDVPKMVHIKASKKGEIKAGDIEHDAEIEIVNPDKVIANLDNGGKLKIEMMVEKGKGFSTSEKNKKANLPVGFIPIDSIYTPVKKVNISIEETRVGQEINYDRLTLQVWTDGSIKPDEAMRESAKVLAGHIDLFVNLGRERDIPAELVRKEEIPQSVLEMSLEDLELSARSLNCLKKENINTVRELLSYSLEDMMKLKNFGAKSLDEVREKLAEYKISLRGEEPKNEA